MPLASTSDVAIITVGLVLAGLYLFRDSIFQANTSSSVAVSSNSKVSENGGGNPRDFIAKMKAGKKRLAIFYGSQTGTAEEYAIRLAKEAKSKFGLASLVCDPEEYDFDNLDQVPEDCAVIFVMATYGEGEPTDNAVTLMQNLNEDSFEFSNGEHKLEGLKYVIFGLGNRTYEHYNEIARKVDGELTKMGAIRIGERGEGDDDKSMEEDYLEWKDGMWAAFSEIMGVEEGAGADSPDFVVKELESHPPEKVYLGELSARALTKTRGIHDAKNPYAAPILVARELFNMGKDRNCIHMEVNIEGSGITYQHGDHIGVWPTNPEVEVDRLLCALGLYDKRDTVIGIESLDPALAKVPFPVPTTYGTVLRHYIDICSVTGRQILGTFAKFAPTPEAGDLLRKWNSDKAVYASFVHDGCLKLGEVLQLSAGNDISAKPTPNNTTPWAIPFDIIVSAIPRLQPRYYSISSSPKMHPTTVHITAVVLKYQSITSEATSAKWVYGVGTNFLQNLKYAVNEEPVDLPLVCENGNAKPESMDIMPSYLIEGPRSAYRDEKIYKVPVHVRRSTFRLPTNPRNPIIMVGPGTGIAPFRGFVQERVALARRSIEKNGPDALKDWGPMYLYYGCRYSKQDFLYADEWPQYTAELGSKFIMRTAFSRDDPKNKRYVQHLMWDDHETLAELIAEGKAYIFICGDAKGMCKDVEDGLVKMLGERKVKTKGEGDAEKEGQQELKLLKERSRLMLDVWS